MYDLRPLSTRRTSFKTVENVFSFRYGVFHTHFHCTICKIVHFFLFYKMSTFYTSYKFLNSWNSVFSFRYGVFHTHFHCTICVTSRNTKFKNAFFLFYKMSTFYTSYKFLNSWNSVFSFRYGVFHTHFHCTICVTSRNVKNYKNLDMFSCFTKCPLSTRRTSFINSWNSVFSFRYGVFHTHFHCTICVTSRNAKFQKRVFLVLQNVHILHVVQVFKQLK